MEQKSPEDVTVADLRALIGNVGEGKRLEFKALLPGTSDAEKREFLKDVTALANSEGGDILFGVSQDSVTRTASGFDPILNGLLDAQIVRLDQILAGGVRPRVPGVRMIPIEVESGKSVLILRVPASHLAPHQVTFNNAYKFYGRNNNGAYLIEVDELRDMILRRASIPEQMREFRRNRIDLIRCIPEDMPSPVSYERKLVVHYIPERTFGKRGDVDASILADAGLRNKVTASGAPTRADLGLSHRSNIDGFVFMNGLSSDILQFYIQTFDDGVLEFVDGIALYALDNNQLISPIRLEETLFLQYEFAQRLFSVLGIDGRVGIFASALGGRNLTIELEPRYRLAPLMFTGHGTLLGRDPALFNGLTIDDMRVVEAKAALEPLIQQIWRSFGFPNACTYRDNAYVGNSWSRA